MATDTEILDWLEEQYGLHRELEIVYVVDGYKDAGAPSELNGGLGLLVYRRDDINTVLRTLDECEKIIASQQAKIDSLMLEYCPDEMTEDQKENWTKNQIVAPNA